MNFRIVAIPVLAAICVGSPVLASGIDGTGGEEQRRRDRGGENRRYRSRAVVPRSRPRIAVPVVRPNININIGNRRPRYYGPRYYDHWARSYYRWSPVRYAPWGLISAGIGFSNFGVYGSWGPPYVYGHTHYGHGPGYYAHAPGFDYGGVRLRMRPRDAHVFVDGYYAGIVDDYDGTFQQLRLEQGAHKVEVRMPGFEDLELDIYVQPGRTITVHEDLRPRP
jgi:hypothetical protein